jgi:hypothetical protein
VSKSHWQPFAPKFKAEPQLGESVTYDPSDKVQSVSAWCSQCKSWEQHDLYTNHGVRVKRVCHNCGKERLL